MRKERDDKGFMVRSKGKTMKCSRYALGVTLAVFLPLAGYDGPLAQSTSEQEQSSIYNPEPSVTVGAISQQFTVALRDGYSLAPFMAAEYTFVYHTSDRGDGQVDGDAKGLSGAAIDQSIDLQMIYDGQGWACPPREPSKKNAQFRLRDSLQNWDRFEVLDINRDNNTAYIVGEGESGYIAITVASSGAIERLEYRNEDPG